jgi:hypothetical protein
VESKTPVCQKRWLSRGVGSVEGQFYALTRSRSHRFVRLYLQISYARLFRTNQDRYEVPPSIIGGTTGDCRLQTECVDSAKSYTRLPRLLNLVSNPSFSTVLIKICCAAFSCDAIIADIKALTLAGLEKEEGVIGDQDGRRGRQGPAPLCD